MTMEPEEEFEDEDQGNKKHGLHLGDNLVKN